jgi:hypothetical protein
MTIAHYSAASKLHVVVMGAGLSYKLSRKIVETVKSPATNLSIPLPILCNA